MDGKLMVVAGGIPGRLGEVRVIDLSSGKVIQVLHKSEDLCFAAHFSPDDTKLATGGADGTVRVFEVETGMSWWSFPIIRIGSIMLLGIQMERWSRLPVGTTQPRYLMSLKKASI